MSMANPIALYVKTHDRLWVPLGDKAHWMDLYEFVKWYYT